ncbi:MAG: SUMF1/EgtB/PvdO family nonheme iron enzyme [Sphaerochaeta sp.]|nr:SUMF1/EgtB/PvdO family nonheme iron enzyme [Sphaerochaeta sp.]
MKRHIELPQVKEVQLPQFLGMRPGIYIATLLIVVIIAVIFLVCFLPGIIKGGRYVTFTSPLANTGISINGTYLGGTPYQFFVPSGEHEVTFTKGGTTIGKTTLNVGHPVFLTWLFHRTNKLESDITGLTTQEKAAINLFNVQEIMTISAITDFDTVHPYPPVFSNLVEDALAMDLDEKTQNDSFALAANFITSNTMLSDALEAKGKMNAKTSELIRKTLEVAQRLFSNSTTEEVGLLEQDHLVKGTRTTLKANDFEQAGITYPASSFVMGTKVPLIFAETNKAGIEVQTQGFSIANTPVSQYQWALFIEENPQWDKNQVENLQQDNLTDEYYLSGILPSVVFATGKPVHNISYKAAEAFCTWLSDLTGKDVFIPTQEMWTLAALQAKDKAYARSLTITDGDRTTPLAMLGGVWEFTQSPYIPLQRVTDYQEVAKLYQTFAISTDVIVKGGSYLNKASSIDEHTVGAVDTTACGDLIGFRIAWKN